MFLGAAVASVASAQLGSPVPSAELGQIRCSATALAPLVRIEGTSELVGDIAITCENRGEGRGFEPSGFLVVDLAVSLSVGIANRSGFGLGADVTDAVLVVNEKSCLASTSERSFGDCGANGRTVQDPMLARLSSASPGLLLWSGVALPIPGAAIGSEAARAVPLEDCVGRYGVAGGCHPTTTSVRLTNIRVNAAQAGVGSDARSGAIPIEAAVSMSSAGGSVVLEAGTLPVAHAAPGVSALARSVQAGRLCSEGEAFGEVRVLEGFASAFKAVAGHSLEPGRPGWRDDYYPTAAGTAARPGPTRLRIGFSALPEGISIAAPVAPVCASEGGAAGLRLGLVQGASASGLGGTVVPDGMARDVPLTVSEAAEAFAVYQVLATDPSAQEECRIQFRLNQSATDGPAIRGGRVTVDASLAPIGPAASGGPLGEGPRFVAPERVPRPSFPVGECGTTLFFPFVTNQTTFDTAVVLVNTSADPLGTRYQPGSCALTFHGVGLEGEQPPTFRRMFEIDAGEQVAFRLSSGNAARGVDPLPDFQGYLVAQCSFQYAHGFAFVTEQVGGASVLAQGYLAEVVSQSGESARSGTAP
ncbi:MAG: hypothetical protein F4Y47_14085 [Acidobacteriia bacterium]|nr:hypothetical protein [Terriglobia bacterium]MYK10353.1 hypothetical protein [Terriglobia bacterium]